MSERTGRVLSHLLLGLVLLLPVVLAQEGKGKVENYSAVAMGTGGSVGGRTIMFSLRITDYMSDAELNKYAELLKEGGQDALRKALEKLDMGQLSPTGRTGNTIAIARKRQIGSQTVLTIVTARVMPFIELYSAGRSTDYPFGLMRISFNEKGEGTGQVMAAAKIRFNKKKNEYEIESYGNQYIKIVNARKEK